MDYKKQQEQRQVKLIEQGLCFDGAEGGGNFMECARPFVLKNPHRQEKTSPNLYHSIRENCATEYFKANNISWWHGEGPTGHTLSSQIACLNHLMPIMQDPNAVLALLNGISNEFAEVLPLSTLHLPASADKLPISTDIRPEPTYVAFEVVGYREVTDPQGRITKKSILNERGLKRGSNCTSVDALIWAKKRTGDTLLVPIEWKYTESYPDCDKSTEGENGRTGRARQNIYNRLISESAQLKSPERYEGSIYYQEPFYQLMRQTLWAEQVVKQCSNMDFLHLHVIPQANSELLEKTYKVSGQQMEQTWRSCLTDNSKYRIIDPQVLFAPLRDMPRYKNLMTYLATRYW